jgi:hypothetical protein
MNLAKILKASERDHKESYGNHSICVFFLVLNLDGWIKSGRDKISACGPQIEPNVHHTNEKLKD